MSYQTITLVGNPGADGEMRYTPGGKAVASFSLAVSKKWNAADGAKQEKTTWFRVTFWDKQAELVSNYVKKGKEVMVIGEVEEARAFTDNSGNNRASLEVTGKQLVFLSGGGGHSNGDDSGAHAMAAEAQGKKAPVKDNSVPF